MLKRNEIIGAMTAAGLSPRRSLGQNFIVEPNVISRIIELAEVGPSTNVVEIGAGIGSLTIGLAQAGAQVLAIETDPRLVPLLNEHLVERQLDERVELWNRDATDQNWSELDARFADGWMVVANLPYNVGTSIVLDLLEQSSGCNRLLVMLQTEVAQRLVATPGTSPVGVTTMKAAYWATGSIKMTVSPGAFWPRPKVESSVVELLRRPQPAVDAPTKVLFGLLDTSYGQRRKMLRRSLAGVPVEAFERAGVDSSSRPESLDIEAWGRLATAVASVDDAATDGG